LQFRLFLVFFSGEMLSLTVHQVKSSAHPGVKKIYLTWLKVKFFFTFSALNF